MFSVQRASRYLITALIINKNEAMKPAPSPTLEFGHETGSVLPRHGQRNQTSSISKPFTYDARTEENLNHQVRIFSTQEFPTFQPVAEDLKAILQKLQTF